MTAAAVFLTACHRSASQRFPLPLPLPLRGKGLGRPDPEASIASRDIFKASLQGTPCDQALAAMSYTNDLRALLT